MNMSFQELQEKGTSTGFTDPIYVKSKSDQIQRDFDEAKARYGGQAKIRELVRQLGNTRDPSGQVGFKPVWDSLRDVELVVEDLREFDSAL